MIDSELSEAKLVAMKAISLRTLGYPFNLAFAQSRERLPLGKTGKVEGLMSTVGAG